MLKTKHGPMCRPLSGVVAESCGHKSLVTLSYNRTTRFGDSETRTECGPPSPHYSHDAPSTLAMAIRGQSNPTAAPSVAVSMPIYPDLADLKRAQKVSRRARSLSRCFPVPSGCESVGGDEMPAATAWSAPGRPSSPTGLREPGIPNSLGFQSSQTTAAEYTGGLFPGRDRASRDN